MIKTFTQIVVLSMAPFLWSQQVQPVFPDIISQFPNVRDFTIGATEEEAYFTAQSVLGDLSVIMRVQDAKASVPQLTIASFSGEHSDLEPFLAPDGLSLYFVSNRPANENDTTKDFDIWKVTRSSLSDAWSEPQRLPAPVNSELNEF